MMEGLQMVLNDDDLLKKVTHLAGRLTNTAPLMLGIQKALVSETLLNFQSQGRPKWAGLAPSTLASYAAQGKSRNMILQQNGYLKGSVQGSSTNQSATVGAGSGPSAAYAAIQQQGGTTRPHLIVPKNKKVLAFGGHFARSVQHPGSKIPARPYLPMDANGNLQHEAELTILDVIGHYWEGSL